MEDHLSWRVSFILLFLCSFKGRLGPDSMACIFEIGSNLLDMDGQPRVPESRSEKMREIYFLALCHTWSTLIGGKHRSELHEVKEML